MGLDMYLYRAGNDGDLSEIIYWRKANHIHGFFERLKDSEYKLESLERIEVSKQDLVNLLETCYEVLYDETCKEVVLPRVPGFFFGTYTYEEDYYQDIIDTILKVEDILLNDYKKNTKYFYDSWY